MIGARTHVKLLRRFGITLIFLPELITTPFGVTLVLVARYLSRRLETSQNKRIREMVEYYLAHTGRFSDDADGESSAPGSVKHYTQSEERPIPRQYTGSRSFEANLAPSVWQNWQDMRSRTVHHTMDMQSLSGRYKAGDSFKVEPGWADTPRRAEKTIHHTINREWLSRRYEGEGSSVNMSLLSQRYKTGDVGQTKVKHHAINMALLRQRYGAAASSTTILNALQDNNYYYDVVSRENVIGGYECSRIGNPVDTLKKRKNTKGQRENYLRYRYAFMSI
jgi:hypothetical protein